VRTLGLVGKPAPPVQSDTSARRLHRLSSGPAKFRASAHSATFEFTKLKPIANSDETISMAAGRFSLQRHGAELLQDLLGLWPKFLPYARRE
jgi:hypothetical protein